LAPGGAQVIFSRYGCILALAFAALAPAPARAQVTFDCVTRPSMTLKIGTPVATTLHAVDVERGDRVTRGQVLARLDSAVEAADLELHTARAGSTAEVSARSVRAELARTELLRAERLVESSTISRQRVDELRAAMRVAQEELALATLNHRLSQLELTRAQAALAQRTIRSPIDAVVVARVLGPGEFAHQDTHIVELAAVTPLHVEAYPPVRFFGAIRAGAPGRVSLPYQAAPDVTAAVQVADPVFDAASGTFGLRLLLPNPDGATPAGLRCRVSFDIPDPGR
jgi:RND family efflux transporter MFP subunit